MHLDFRAAALEEIDQTRTPFSHDRLLTVGASEIGGCARRTAYEKSETPPDESFSPNFGAAKRGDILEDAWTVPVVRRAVGKIGGTLIWAGQNAQRTVISENWKLSATVDGLATGLHPQALAPYGATLIGRHPTDNAVIVEMKSFDPRKDDSAFPIAQHLMQLQAQLGLVNHDQSHSYRPRWGVVVYVNASFVDDVRVYPDFYRRFEFHNLIRRARTIYDIPPEKHPPEGAIAGGSECEYCPFKERCGAVETARPTRLTNRSPFSRKQADHLRSAILTVDRERDLIKAAKERKTFAEHEIKRVMTDTNTRNVAMLSQNRRVISARWLKTAGPVRFDFAKMAEQLMEDGHDLQKFRTRGASSQRLAVKVSKPNEPLPKIPLSKLDKTEANRTEPRPDDYPNEEDFEDEF